MQSFLNQLEMAHLTHKLPWATLADAVPLDRETWRHRNVREPFLVKKRYLAGCLADAIAEFAATDRRSEADKAKYDVEQWPSGFGPPLSLTGAGALDGFLPSVLDGYVVLNLLAADEARLRPVLFPTGRNGGLACHAGHYDGALPDWLAELARPLLTNRGFGEPVPLQGDAQAAQHLRDYCAELFRVMYARPDLFTRERVFYYVEGVLSY